MPLEPTGDAPGSLVIASQIAHFLHWPTDRPSPPGAQPSARAATAHRRRRRGSLKRQWLRPAPTADGGVVSAPRDLRIPLRVGSVPSNCAARPLSRANGEAPSRLGRAEPRRKLRPASGIGTARAHDWVADADEPPPNCDPLALAAAGANHGVAPVRRTPAADRPPQHGNEGPVEQRGCRDGAVARDLWQPGPLGVGLPDEVAPTRSAGRAPSAESAGLAPSVRSGRRERRQVDGTAA